MKKTCNVLLALALLFNALPVQAQDDDDNKQRKRYEFFKERSISKTYPASGNTLDITNSFGNVKIITWDKNEIKVDIHIEASSNKKEVMERNFDNIQVKDAQSGNKITFKTELDDVNNNDKDKNQDCNNCSSTMHIDYEVHMPANNTLKIENSFGNIVIPDYNGAVSLNSQFGSLTAGKLQKVDNLEVGFGKAELKNLNNVDATFKFSKINIDVLSGACKLDIEFCSFSKFNLGGDLSSLKLNNSYSTVNLRPAASFSATYSITTSFGSVVDRSSIGIKRTDEPSQYGPDMDRTYSGKSGSGAAKIEASTSFGKIIIGDATAEDMKEDSKNKNKEKNRTVI